MTGPDINRPRYGSNAIGSFAIGVSPIGSIPRFDYWSTAISQYANSPILMGMVANFFGAADQTANFDAFHDNIWNILTANGYGLDVWGRIVGVARVINVANSNRYLGFEEATVISGDPFGQSPFYVGVPLTSNFALSDTAFRVLILAKALSNISDGSIKSINNILMSLFAGRGNAYVTDGNNMTMTYTFKFALQPVELAIISQSGVLPRPCGVAATIVQI